MSSLHFLTFSAESHKELEKIISEAKERIENSFPNSADYLSNYNGANNNHLPIRVAVFGSSCEEIIEKLKAQEYHITPEVPTRNCSNQKPKLCFQFTGQGSQFYGMGEGLYSSFPTYRKEFDKCSLFFKQKYGLDLSRYPADIENKSTFLQKAFGLLPTLCLQYSLFKLWESWNIKPDTILTHSLGEYAAAIQCGYISFEVAATILTEECRYFELLLKDGRMLVIKQNKEQTYKLIKQLEQQSENAKLEIALDNSPSQVVVSGKAKSIESFQNICETNGVHNRLIPVNLAYHSTMMRPVYHHCLRKTSSLNFSNKPAAPAVGFPYISGMSGRKLRDGEMCAKFWCDHFTSPVNFQSGAATAIIDEGCEFFVEIGPRPILSAFMHEIFENMKRNHHEANKQPKQNHIYCLPSIKPNSDETSTILDTLAQLYVNGWNVSFQV